MKSLKEIEAETADIEARLAKAQELIAEKRRKQGIKRAKPSPEKFESNFDATLHQIWKMLGVQQDSESLENFLEEALKQQISRLEYMEYHNTPNEEYTGPNYYANICTQKGRIEGIAGILAALRGTSLNTERLRAIM